MVTLGCFYFFSNNLFVQIHLLSSFVESTLLFLSSIICHLLTMCVEVIEKTFQTAPYEVPSIALVRLHASLICFARPGVLRKRPCGRKEPGRVTPVDWICYRHRMTLAMTSRGKAGIFVSKQTAPETSLTQFRKSRERASCTPEENRQSLPPSFNTNVKINTRQCVI